MSSSAPSPELSVYKRSFRQRFETSISAGTHDYSFKFPKDTWKVGMRREGAAGGRGGG